MLLKSFILTAYLLLFLLCKNKRSTSMHTLTRAFALLPPCLVHRCIEKNSVFINDFLANISCHKTLCLVFLFGVTSPLHACAKHKIITLWLIMVTLRVTIKGFALACKRFALDRNPKGYHGPPKAALAVCAF